MPTGLYVNAGQGGGALFDSLAPGAVVENFTVDGSVEAQSGTGWGADMRAAGAVKNAFGKADKRITIRNVGNYADVAARSSADRAGGYAGGILSIGYHVDIVGCFNEGDILTGHYGGGIFGYGSEWLNYSYMNIADCYNVGDVRATFGGSSSTNWGYAGGIAGYGAALENCYNAGDAVNDSGQAYGVNLGSIAGYSFKVTDCYAVEDADCIVDQGAGLSIVSLEEMQAPDFSTKLGDSFGYTEGSTPTLVWQGLSGKPSIVAQPVDVQCLVGEKATLSLDAALPADGEVGADGALSYQWYSVTDKSYEGAVAIEAATSSSYEASTADPFTGYVFCVVTNTFGGKASFAYSDIVLLDVASTLAATPEITVTESREGVYGGDPIEDLAVTVTNSAAQGMSPILKYQWYTSDQNDFGTAEVIEGATDATYAAPELVGANYYWCEVTNDYTANSSASALGGPAVVTISAEDVHIKTAEDLVALQQNVEGGADYKGVKVYVDANIDLSSVCSAETQSWKPIGSASAPFRGAFDGGYHVISNLYASADSENAGLFGYVGEGAVVENLAVEGSVTKSGWNSYASGIVAYASGTEVEPVVLRNLRNEADVNSSNGWNGGVVAYASYVDIIRCGNLGTMSGSGVLHGGIAADAIQTRIVDCYNAGDLTNDNNYSQTGGIVGRMDGRGRSELSNLVNVGRLSCGSDSANTIAGSTIYGTPKGDKATWFALSGTFPGKYVSWDDAQTYYVSASWLASDKAVSALGSAWVKGESHPVLSWEGILVGSPDITEHPVGGEYAIGSTVSLSVAASLPEGVDTSGVLSYQWQKSADGIVFEDIEDATAATLTIDTASASALYYRCVVSNTWGAGEDVSSASAVSQAAGVVILSGKAAGKPSITVQPAENIEASFGAEAEALVVAADVVEDDEAAKGTLFYQWYVSDVNDFAKAVPVEGAVAASYVPATCFSGVKYYWCEIANVYELAKESSVVSDSAKVTVDGSYSIVTADDLWALQDLAKDGATFENVRIALNGDIDMGASAEKPWESLPVFSGIFDGGEYVISGYYSTTGGMFGTLTGSASVMNLTLRGEINAPEAEYVAGIANEAEYVDDTHQVTITNVCSDVDVNAANYAAGILSRCMSSSIDATAAIKGCVNKGDITVSPAGSSTAPVAAGIIDSCVNEGDVVVGGAHSVASQLAGIVSSCGAPSNCLNVGKVGDAQSSTDAPIYCSARRDPAVSTNNYYLDSTGTAMTQDGATAKTDEELKAAGMAAQISSEFVDVAASYPQLAWLVETGAPVITTQPEGAFYVTGTDKAADLVVVAELPTAPYAGHDGTLSYQWQKSSDKVAFADIEGATNASFALTGFGDVGTTYYRCVVANTYGSGLVKTVESDIVAIVVNDTEAAAPVISEQPKDVEGAMSEGVEFSVTAGFPENAAEGSTGEISYQWYACDDAEGSNPVAIEGATEATYAPSFGAPGAYYFKVVVSNVFHGSVASSVESDVACATIEADLVIETAADLLAFANAVNGADGSGPQTFEGKLVVLANDIDLSTDEGTKVWTAPIGASKNTRGNSFRGTFDGQGHTVSNLKIDNYSEYAYVGLFGLVRNGVVKNLTVSGDVVSAAANGRVGLVCGYGYASAFENIETFGSVSSAEGVRTTAMGGAIGSAASEPTAISNVVNWAEVTARTTGRCDVGGVAGAASAETVSRCVNWGDVAMVSPVENSCSVGGVVGYGSGMTFAECSNHGDVTNASPYDSSTTGGVVANASNHVIVDCYNVASVRSCAETASNYNPRGTGGVVGGASYATLENCYSVGDVSYVEATYASAGGLAGNAAGVVVVNSYYLEESCAKESGAGEALLAGDMTGVAFAARLGDAYRQTGGYPIFAWETGDGSPAIEVHPSAATDQYVQGDEGETLSVSASLPYGDLLGSESNGGSLTYQWYSRVDGGEPAAIEGATDSTFKIETDVETGLYDYWCRVTNTWADGSKSVDSNAVTVRVVSTLEPVEPYIISQPTTVYYELGATLDSGAIPMSIVVDQDEELIGELSYQWYAAKTIESYRNATGTLLEGATDSEYMPYTGKIGTVYYYCIVTNTFEGIKTASTKSNVVKARTWSVEAAAPVVSGQPSEKAIYFLGDEAAALEVVAAKPVAPADVVGGLADRTAHLSYQWYETATGLADPTADAAVDGATGSTFVPSTNSEVGLYHYYCVVTNNFETTYPASSQTSSVVSEVSDVYLKSRIEVATPELDSFGMADASYVQGQGASPLYVDVLNAGVEGMGSLSYQWQQEIGGVWTDIEEATDYSYTPSTSVNAGDYRYRCVVLNTFELVKEASAVSEVSTVSVRPVVIESVSDLLAFCDNVNAGADYAGLTVELANDIDLSGEDWVPIGAFSPFAGTFDGKGHKIAGLYYEGAPSTPVGLFGYLGCAVVKNLEVEGSITVTGGDSQPFNAYVGGLAGYQTDGLVLENVGVDVDIYVDDAAATWDYIGGLIGCATSVSNSVSCRLSMDSCYVKGSVTESSAGGSVSGLIYAGGFVGSAAYGNAASVVSLTDCYNMAEVAVDGAYVGGFFGQSNRSVVFDGCYNAGTVSVSASAEPTAEAFVSVGSTPTFSNCYYLEGSADYVYYNGVGYDGVAVKADADMKAASFAATMGSGYKVGDIYPVLKWEVDAGMPVISKQPASIVVLKGSSDTSLFVVAGLPAGDGAAAGGELSYQWYQNTAASSEGAVAIEGATGSTLVPSADEPGVTYYYCVVTNTYSGGKRSCESSYAVVTVVSDTPVAVPTVSEQPVGAEYARGDRAAALAVSAAVTGEGAGELSYQWYKGSSDSFTSATAIGGATSATYLPSTSDVGYDYYWCVVTNTFEGVRVATAMSDCAVVHVKGDLQVSTPEQLVKLRDEVNAGVTYQGVAVELLNDIDLGTLGENWSGIGTNSNVNCFRGTFEGNGHVVDLGDAASSGLFRFVNGATVRNFVVKGTVSTGGSNVGGAVGYAAGTSASPTLVENIGNEASVSGGTYTGGVVGGGGSYVTVRGCYNKGAVATSGSIGYAGGLVGYLNDRCVVENCYNAFSMKSDVAAIIGRINNSTKGTIRNCFDAGSNSKMAGAYNIENAARKCYSLTVGSNAFTKITEAAMSDPEFAATLGSAFKVGDTHPALIWERTPFGAPVITVQPAAAGCMVGYDAPALVVVAEGPAGDKEPTQGNTLTYQWYETETGVADPANDALIEGATESSYAPANHPMGKRMFYCVVTNTWDGGSASITSDVAVYSVTDRTPAAVPVLTGQPEGDKTYQQRGVAAQLSVSAEVSDEGAGELSYAWYRNMTGVADPAVDELVGEERVFTPSTTEELGTSFYYCVVTNTYEGAKRASTTSNLAAITLTPIEISTGQQLASFVSAGIVDYNKAETVNNLVGVLTADITLTNLIAFGSGGRWASDYFCATLDGQGHTIDISNVWPSNGVYQAGLFGAVGPGAVLENFVVTGSVLSNNYGYFDAGVACWANGAADNPVTIRNVGNEATVSGSQGRCVAGVVAYANNCVIDSCYNKGTVDVPTYNGGGVVNTAYNSVITNCYNAGNVTVAKVFNDASYGAAGVVASADPTTVVKNCYNVGTVVMSSAEQSDIDATGAVVGNMRDGATASNNYYLEGSYAFDRSGAEPMASEAMKTEVFVGELNADGSFFEYVEGSYPALAWEGRHYLGEEGFSIEPIVDVVYNGSAIEPEVVVSAGEGEAKLVLVEGEDYEVSYYANSFVGTAYVKVTGIGSYDGTLETSFGILPLSLDAAEFETIPDLFYTGSELKPAVSIKAGGSLLVEGKDYTVSYFDTYDYPMTVLEPGTYYAVATGIGMVSGSKTSDTFEVVGYDPISELQITGPADVTYNGTEQKPQVTVYDESKDRTLEEGVDYELAFTDNLNAGTASVEISGLGVYEGVVTKTFEIGKASLTVEAKDASKAVGEKDPALLADADGLVGSDVLSGYQIVRADGEDAGKYAITPSDAVIMRGDVEASSNYEIDYVAAEFAIVGGWNRLFGYDYTDTMQAITSAGFADGSCKAVIVATSTGYWDALGASGLAGLLDAPVLLTGKSGLPEQTAAEIKRLAHEDGMTVYIAGGPGVISSEIETEIESIVGVIGVERAYGETMLDTALEIYRAGGDQWGTTAIVATAGGFQDALSIAPYSYAYDAPIFLTSGSTKVLTDEAVQAIKDGGFERVIIVGGPGVIKSDVEGQLDGIKTERLYGETAYDTSGAVANWCLTQGMSVDKMGVATGANYLDALAGASFCGKNNAVLVLVHDDYRTCLDMVVAANAADICQGYVFGGESVVSAETFELLSAALEG